jgi:hypothetical protein
MLQSVEEVLAQADAALDALASIDYKTLDDAQVRHTIVKIHQLGNRMDAVRTRAAGAVDRYLDTGRATPTTWLAYTCHLKKGVAHGEVTRSRALRSMPATAEAYDAGAITTDHVRVLAAACRSNQTLFEKAEDELLIDAKTRRFDQFARQVDYFRQVADADGVEDEALNAHDQRNLHCSRTFENTVRLDGSLDPIGGTIYKNELERLEHQLFLEDWTDARARLGDNATANDLRRTPEQRRADAQVEMARRSAAMPADAKQAVVLLTVLVGYETFAGRMCQLADGTVITPGQIVSLFPDSPVDIDVERAVFSAPSRITDLGRRRRLFTGGARRAVQLAHLECTHDTCDQPYERCETDHIQPWAQGGPTNQANGRLRCPRHHDGRRRSPPPRNTDDDDPDDEHAATD